MSTFLVFRWLLGQPTRSYAYTVCFKIYMDNITRISMENITHQSDSHIGCGIHKRAYGHLWDGINALIGISTGSSRYLTWVLNISIILFYCSITNCPYIWQHKTRHIYCLTIACILAMFLSCRVTIHLGLLRTFLAFKAEFSHPREPFTPRQVRYIYSYQDDDWDQSHFMLPLGQELYPSSLNGCPQDSVS
jgi:hypothetical protein